MCLAIPGKVIKVDGRQATVKYPQVIRKALVGDVTPKVGDYVLVQMGIIIRILSEKDAKISMQAWA
jgi:hydrogenase expression/formation protein HypC